MDPEEEPRLELPARFHSEETGAPFTICIECKLPLVECSAGYVVQKCSNGSETIFEFALCMPCGEALHASYSEESQRKLKAFFTDNVDPGARYDDTWSLSKKEFADHLLTHCLTCGETPEPGKPSTIAAVCDGSDMLVGSGPIRLCCNCEESLNALVSRQTRDEWDRFIGRNFDLPPADALTPDGRPVLVL